MNGVPFDLRNSNGIDDQGERMISGDDVEIFSSAVSSPPHCSLRLYFMSPCII